MNPTAATRVAAAAGLLAVALGAFGAHGLKNLLAQNGTADIWEKAVLYHFIHALMLFVLASRKPFPAVPWWSFLIGILIFSGSLYVLAATNIRWLGAITPIGGLSFLLGWAWLVFKPNPAQNQPTLPDPARHWMLVARRTKDDVKMRQAMRWSGRPSHLFSLMV